MNEKEVAELRRRFRAEKSGIARVRGCFVNESREIISRFDQSLGLMRQEESERLLAVLRKTLTGTLAAGKKADLAVVDFNCRETAPAPMSVSTLVYAGNPHMVTDTLVDGRWVYRDGRFPHLDEERIRALAREAVGRVLSRVKT